MSLEAVRSLFSDTLDPDDLDRMIQGLSALPPPVQRSAINAGLILSDFSKKAAAAYFQNVPERLKVFSTPDLLDPWVGMGIQISQSSAATGIKFFRQGASLFAQIPDPDVQARFVWQGLLLAQQDAHLAFEYYQQAPALLAAVPLSSAEMDQWAAQGVALGRQDYTLAVEYFRISPALLRVLPIPLLPRWVQIVLQLTPLYTALLFIRKSPDVFAGVLAATHAESSIEQLLALTAEIAPQSASRPQHPDLACTTFTSAIEILPPFTAAGLVETFLAAAIRIARMDAELAATFFQNGRSVLDALRPDTSRFAAWVDEGIALLARDPIAAKSYFALESKAARQTLDRLRGGVSLTTVSRALQVFAQGLCGQSVAIAPCAEGESPTTDGRTIYLPAHVGFFPDDTRNRAWYTVATAFQAGFLEFRTFADPRPLTDFFADFPEPALARELFEITEGARVAFHLQQAYPGLRASFIQMRESDLASCRTLMGLTPRGAVLELLRQISLAGKTREAIPPELQSLLFDACRMLGSVQSVEATVAASMQAVTRVYDLLRDESDLPQPSGEMEPFEDRGPQRRGEGAGGGELRPSTRGHLDPERVAKTQAALKEMLQTEGLLKKLKEAELDQMGTGLAQAVGTDNEGAGFTARGAADAEEGGTDTASSPPPTPVSARSVSPSAGAPSTGERRNAARSTRTDEWDVRAGDYRPDWCQVIERDVPNGEGEAVTVSSHGARAILTAFERLRPVGLTRVRGARDGDAFDLDGLVSARVAVRMRQTPFDRIYIQHQRKERSVAAAFLVDLSGSTRQQIAEGGRTILQVEKEALVLLARALWAIGDRFALFGFSGRGREAVDFQIVKSFEERYGPTIDGRIGRLQSAAQNRDGAALRHATRLLSAQPERIKPLFLISDGKPLDDDYDGGYAMADTKMALREARRAGIHPFCITVDREGAESVRGMYGDTAYLVIDRVETLPEKLPRIYKRLTT
jgi:hypothetical protein